MPTILLRRGVGSSIATTLPVALRSGLSFILHVNQTHCYSFTPGRLAIGDTAGDTAGEVIVSFA